MPKLITAIPKYRKKSRRDRESWAVVCINGREHFLGLCGSRASKRPYDRLISQWHASGRSSRFGLPDDHVAEVTVADLIPAYRKWATEYYRHKRWLVDWYR